MKTKKLFSIMLAALLVIASIAVPASATRSVPENKVTGATAPANILQYLEYCEVEINDDSVIETTESVSRASDDGAALHITTKTGDYIEETFLTYYDTDGDTLNKKDITLIFNTATRDSGGTDFYKAGIIVKMTAVYTRTIQGQNYVHLTGHYFSIYKDTASPTINRIETDAFLGGKLYTVSSGNYISTNRSTAYTSDYDKDFPAYNTVYSGYSPMPSNEAIVPLNYDGGLGVEYALYVNNSSSPYSDLYKISNGWF